MTLLPPGRYDLLDGTGAVIGPSFCHVRVPSGPQGGGAWTFQILAAPDLPPGPKPPWHYPVATVENHLSERAVVTRVFGEQRLWHLTPSGEVYTAYAWVLRPGEADVFPRDRATQTWDWGFYNADLVPRVKAFTVHREAEQTAEWVEFDCSGPEECNDLAPTLCGRIFAYRADPTRPWPGEDHPWLARSVHEALARVLSGEVPVSNRLVPAGV